MAPREQKAHAPWLAMRQEVMGLSPEDAAERVLTSMEARYPPVSAESIARRLGISVRREEGQRWSGIVETGDNGTARIWLNAAEPSVRQRFTIAHEIGHALLHQLGEQYRDALFGGTHEETQANQFGATLLMPFWMLQPLARAGHRPHKLAEMFGVSPHAMNIRLREMYGLPMTW